MKIYKMMYLVLEIDNLGILKKKDFYNKDNMKKIKMVKDQQQKAVSKKIHLYI